MISIEFAAPELIVLRQLIDIAVRARGMDVAQVALVLDKRIADALDTAQKKQEEENRLKVVQ